MSRLGYLAGYCVLPPDRLPLLFPSRTTDGRTALDNNLDKRADTVVGLIGSLARSGDVRSRAPFPSQRARLSLPPLIHCSRIVFDNLHYASSLHEGAPRKA
jgi:hypothetical protein